MKTVSLPVVAFAVVLSFALGFGLARWRKPEHAKGRAASELAPLLSSRRDSVLTIAPEQAQADARLATDSPQDFLRALDGTSKLQARARIAAAASAMSLADVTKLAKAIQVMGYGGPRQTEFTNAVFERWADLDTEGLIQAARTTHSYFTLRWQGISFAFQKLAEADPDSAWKRAKEMPGEMRYGATRATIRKISEQDPAKALGFIRAWRSWGSVDLGSEVMQRWMGRDPKAALTAFEGLPAGELRSRATDALGETFSLTDPEGALAWAKALKNPAEQRRVIGQVLGVVAEEDPQKALAMASDPAFSANRRQAMVLAVHHWAKQDFDAALNYAMNSKNPADQLSMLRTLNGEASHEDQKKLLALVDKFPASAAKDIHRGALHLALESGLEDPVELLRGIKSPSLREELVKEASSNWSTTLEQRKEFFSMLQPTSQTTERASDLARSLGGYDPEAALQWAASLDSADLRKSATVSALSTLANNDPKAAAAKATALDDAQSRSEAIRKVAATWHGTDNQAALAWANGLAGADKTAALGALVQDSLESSPDRARDLYRQFAASLSPEDAAKADNTAVARSVATTLTENDPPSAVAWAQSVTGEAREEALAGVASKWASYDPVATSEWVRSLPEGEGRDAAASNLVSAIARDDPESAWAWMSSISDAGKRREAAAQTLAAWKAHGATEAARRALEAGSFTPDERKELVKKLQ